MRLLPWLLLFTACTSTRPIFKIGLSAPFEGLYRRSGYEALAAMRAAIAETPVEGFGVMPLALDNSLDPARTFAKLLQDDSLRAVIGPLTPEVMMAVHQPFSATNLLWFTPFALQPQGLIAPLADQQWQLAWLQALAPQLLAHNCQRLVLVGWETGWSTFDPKAGSVQIGIEIVLIRQLEEVRAGDGVVWVGSAQAGGQFLGDLRGVQPDLPFWTGLQGGDPVFTEQTEIKGPSYWSAWLTDEYDSWASQHSPNTPMAYIVYYETRQAIATLPIDTSRRAVVDAANQSKSEWQLRIFPLKQP